MWGALWDGLLVVERGEESARSAREREEGRARGALGRREQEDQKKALAEEEKNRRKRRAQRMARRVDGLLSAPQPDYSNPVLVQIVDVLKSLRHFVAPLCGGSWVEWHAPGHCQVCGTPVDRKEKGLHCSNGGHRICWACMCNNIRWESLGPSYDAKLAAMSADDDADSADNGDVPGARGPRATKPRRKQEAWGAWSTAGARAGWMTACPAARRNAQWLWAFVEVAAEWPPQDTGAQTEYDLRDCGSQTLRVDRTAAGVNTTARECADAATWVAFGALLQRTDAATQATMTVAGAGSLHTLIRWADAATQRGAPAAADAAAQTAAAAGTPAAVSPKSSLRSKSSKSDAATQRSLRSVRTTDAEVQVDEVRKAASQAARDDVRAVLQGRWIDGSHNLWAVDGLTAICVAAGGDIRTHRMAPLSPSSGAGVSLLSARTVAFSEAGVAWSDGDEWRRPGQTRAALGAAASGSPSSSGSVDSVDTFLSGLPVEGAEWRASGGCARARSRTAAPAATTARAQSAGPRRHTAGSLGSAPRGSLRGATPPAPPPPSLLHAVVFAPPPPPPSPPSGGPAPSPRPPQPPARRESAVASAVQWVDPRSGNLLRLEASDWQRGALKYTVNGIPRPLIHSITFEAAKDAGQEQIFGRLRFDIGRGALLPIDAGEELLRRLRSVAGLAKVRVDDGAEAPSSPRRPHTLRRATLTAHSM